MSELQWVESTDEKGRTLWYLSNPDDARFYAEVVDVGGGDFWWLVPVSVWSEEVLGRKSFTPEMLSTLGARCYGAGRFMKNQYAKPDNVPDWLRALMTLDGDAERRCWVPVWGGE
ncbi:MAG: hypothetical protein MK101_12190 [Phycisphaerales bacterium]|nr:hypothetical protein [Phycisphaerales bacterium]